MKYSVLFLKGLLLILLLFSTSAQAAKRVALIIGNSNYQNVEILKNPANDAMALAETLQNIGFDDVTLKLDLGNAALQRTLGQFAKQAAGADIAMLYFAGHGIEVGGTNFVIPVDAKLSHVDDVDFEAVDLSKIMRALNRASKLKLVVLDACRNNPFSSTMQRDQGTRSVGRGLSRVNPPGGKTLVAYAAKEGTVAADGTGKHSPYAQALLKHIATPGLDVRIMLGRVHDEVLKSTGRKQEPFTYGALGGGHLYIVPPTTTEPAAPSPAPAAEIDRDALFWSSVRNSNSTRILQTYLNKFPQGQFAELARTRIDIIEQEAEANRQKPTKLSKLSPATQSPAAPGLPPARASAFQLFLAGNKSARARDYANAAQNWLWAAQAGHADAAFKLGRLFERGLGQPKSIPDAKNWYTQAKDMGSSRARKALARLGGSSGSSGKPKLNRKKPAAGRIARTSADRDTAKRALSFFFAGNAASRKGQHRRAHANWRKAAELGHHDAAFKLGEAFRKGTGVRRNFTEAGVWYQKATGLGSTRAQKALRLLKQ